MNAASHSSTEVIVEAPQTPLLRNLYVCGVGDTYGGGGEGDEGGGAGGGEGGEGDEGGDGLRSGHPISGPHRRQLER